MAVHLIIENEASLPDGGPLTYTITGKRGIDIGRDAYLDWCLPDPTRTVSGKHCEIRYRDGGYWLHDVSRNGTFLNRSASRMQEAHRLRDGDRIEIGRYMILVRLEGEEALVAEAPHPEAAQAAPTPYEYWNASADAAPPISPKDLRPAREMQPVQADFREWAIDVPPSVPEGGYQPPPPISAPMVEGMDWARGPAPRPVQPEAAAPMPSPRRPAAAPPALSDPWAAADAGPTPAPWQGEVAWGQGQPGSQAPVPASPTPWAPDIPAAAEAGWAAPDPAAPRPGAIPDDNPWGRPSLGTERVQPLPPVNAPPSEAQPAQARQAHPVASNEGADFVARFAKGAGIAPEILDWRDAGEFAEELGALMRLSTESLKQLLSARAETKRVARAGGHTMIQALDNNPLKFSPTVEDALKIMLGRPSSGYLDARRALEQSYKDLKIHQVKTYSAMQHALRLLMEDLDPAAIEESTESDRGLGALLSSKKAKLWDLYVTRWDTLTSPHEDGIVDAFMMFFAECYDRGGAKS